ncbi:MAG: hypothetical protein P8N52_02000 [Crocinitomicaceae bacterium]|nr:hypothetical protein [Crocinitomicaceae bacterium]MDG1775786.1 hypothetical protein [Crocinitomicaceae bacterium]
MGDIQKYKSQIQEVESLVVKLEDGELNVEELVTLESLTRALHERSVILKYKAFENKVNPGNDSVANTVAPTKEQTKDPVVEVPTIEFSMFSGDEAPVVEESPAIETNEIHEEEVAVQEDPEQIIEPVQEEPMVVKSENDDENSTAGSSFLDLMKSVDNSVNASFNGAKIETLVGAFGLNQKLRYINELFDGSSESFSDAIKSLDAKSTMNEAKDIVSALASEHEWDTEEESVVEFMTVLNRRYA